MAKIQSETIRKPKAKISRPGVHSKSKNSRMKHSKSYKKKNVGQGK